MSKADDIYQHKKQHVKPFEFNEQVASVFADMITRSVPGYEQVLALLPTLVRHLVKVTQDKRELRFYDLGCSLGAGLIALRSGLDAPVELIGIDNSGPMLEQARTQLTSLLEATNPLLKLELADLTGAQLQQCQMAVMHYTLQFIQPQLRDQVLTNIHTALEPGGFLVVSEKIRFDDPTTDQLLTSIHHRFKQDQGYSELEISQKRDAIEKVLIPETLDTHIQRLTKCGFSTVTPWVQNFQFVSLLAVK